MEFVRSASGLSEHCKLGLFPMTERDKPNNQKGHDSFGLFRFLVYNHVALFSLEPANELVHELVPPVLTRKENLSSRTLFAATPELLHTKIHFLDIKRNKSWRRGGSNFHFLDLFRSSQYDEHHHEHVGCEFHLRIFQRDGRQIAPLPGRTTQDKLGSSSSRSQGSFATQIGKSGRWMRPS